MTRDEFMNLTEINPIMAAVKDMDELAKCKDTECRIVYILFGDICTVEDIVDRVKKMGKTALVHIDLITGLSTKEICVDFIKMHTKADGIVSTKSLLIKRAKELGLFTIQRFFMIDALTYRNIQKQTKANNPDVVELMPAGLYKAIRYLSEDIKVPVVASGLVFDKEDVMGALKAGAIAVSTANQKIWYY